MRRSDHFDDHLVVLACRLPDGWVGDRAVTSAAFVAELITEPRRREGSVP